MPAKKASPTRLRQTGKRCASAAISEAKTLLRWIAKRAAGSPPGALRKPVGGPRLRSRRDAAKPACKSPRRVIAARSDRGGEQRFAPPLARKQPVGPARLVEEGR